MKTQTKPKVNRKEQPQGMPMPSGQLAKGIFPIIFLMDKSGSMEADAKIDQLNSVIPDIITGVLKPIEEENPKARMQVAAIRFDDIADIHHEFSALDNFSWSPLAAKGGTSTAQAIRLAASLLTVDYIGERYYEPLLVLVSDGEYTDQKEVYEASIDDLKQSPIGSNARCVAIVCKDQRGEFNEAAFKRFVTNVETDLILVHDASQLARIIKLVTRQFTSSIIVGK